MDKLCEKPHNFLSTYRKIDGAEIVSKNDRNLDCTLTFQTHSILQRFMLRFEVLKLDCNDHLYIYDNAHAAGIHKADISCRNTKQNIGTLFTWVFPLFSAIPFHFNNCFTPLILLPFIDEQITSHYDMLQTIGEQTIASNW